MTASVLAWVLAAAAVPAPVVTRERPVMSTRVTIAVADPIPEAQLEPVFAEAFTVFARVEAVMNEWKADSELSRVNAAAGGGAVTVSPDLCQVLQQALDGAERTGGLFDPTWAALRDLWRFDLDPPRVPSVADLKARCALVDFHEVKIEPTAAGCKVRLAKRGMRLGLGGIAKGWGVDQAVSVLRKRGLHNFFVQAGGDLYMAGKRGERPWRAGVRDPRGPPEQVMAWLDLADAAFSTSGDYEHAFFIDGTRYHHIIDPRTCWPAPASRSVTILAPSAVAAEILSKAAFILGGEAGLKLVEAQGAAAVIIDACGRLHVSEGLRGRLVLTQP